MIRIHEIYESEAGVADHVARAKASWKDFSAFVEWMGNCKATAVPSTGIVNSAW